MSTTVPLLINGEELTTPTLFDITSPSSGRTIWQCASASPSDAQAAAEAAQRAFPAWSATKPAVRRAIFLKAADLLEERAAELQGYMAEETGAAFPFQAFNIKTSAELLRDLAGRIAGALSGSSPVCQEEGTHALVSKEPYGVVLGIAPWNAPFILGIRAIAFALGAGNTCILKGSELSPRCFWAIGSIFTDAGLPAGCLNILFHRTQDAAAVTTALIEAPAVKKVNFTGSTAVGAIIAATAGRNLKPVLMELGGKASAIVCEDADLELAATQCALGAFLHSGQVCMSTERILVHKSVLDDFTPRLKTAINEIFLASSTPGLTLAQSAGVERNHRLIADAVAKGASVLTPEEGQQATAISPFAMPPTVIQGVKPDMDLYYTESFGPSVSVIPVESDEEAIAIANDTDYGLSGAVFTRDLGRGLSVARRVDSGAVHVNSMSIHDEAGLPHGGVKKSGWGRFNADNGLDEFLHTKTITFRI